MAKVKLEEVKEELQKKLKKLVKTKYDGDWDKGFEYYGRKHKPRGKIRKKALREMLKDAGVPARILNGTVDTGTALGEEKVLDAIMLEVGGSGFGDVLTDAKKRDITRAEFKKFVAKIKKKPKKK